MDIRLALMAGSDIPIPECQITLHQPSLREIALIGEHDFFIGIQTLTVSKDMLNIEGNSVLEIISNFHIFMTIMGDKETANKKASVSQVLTLLFPKYKVMFTPQSLIFKEKDNDESHIIDENNFNFLQDVIKKAFCSKNSSDDQQTFNPANKKAKEIADKIMRGRQRVAELNGTADISIFRLYISILSIGLHISVNELLNYTTYQLYDTMERYSLYMNWDLDIRTRLAGGKPDSQPDNWMKNIH